METLEFIEKVKDVFSKSNQIEKYNQFACALRDFSHHKISSFDVISTAKIVFEGYEDLFQQFIIFLPSDLQKNQVREFQSIAFLNKVQSRFCDQLEVYRAFLILMCKYGRKKKQINEVYVEMFKLFYGHADLIHEFEGFLSDNAKLLQKIKKNNAIVMEDRMYQVDTLSCNIHTTIKHLEEILQDPVNFVNIKFKQVELRCFKRLYAERAPEVIEKLKENPSIVLPKILSRLKQKNEELQKSREFSHKFWAELNQFTKEGEKNLK